MNLSVALPPTQVDLKSDDRIAMETQQHKVQFSSSYYLLRQPFQGVVLLADLLFGLGRWKYWGEDKNAARPGV